VAKDFVEDVENLRDMGAKYVFLKQGAYKPEVVAWTMKVASEAKIDMLTFDGAGGGTGMSPVPMMNEMSTPTIHLESQVLMAAEILRKQGRFIPDMAMAGGLINETQIYKAMAMSNLGDGPLIKTSAMARAPLTAVMKSKYFVKLAEKGKLPKSFADQYTGDPKNFFIATRHLENEFPDLKIGKDIPWGAVTKLAEEPPELTMGKLTGKIIPRAGFVIGPYGYEFEWVVRPDEKMIRLLIFNIDEVLNEIGCRYRIATV